MARLSIDDAAPRLERHPLGPRVYWLGRRVHEWHLGVAALFSLAAAGAAGLVHEGPPALAVAAVATWLVAKDWHDLVPASRDTAAWSIGLHRRPHPLRELRRADAVPTLAAVAVAAVSAVNLLSALTPTIAWRGHALLTIATVQELRIFHALAVPLSLGLGAGAYYLYRRRHRALQLTVALLLVLAVVNVCKGLDIEEAAVDVAAAMALWLSRRSFVVRHDPLGRRAGTYAALAVVAAGAVAAFAIVAAAAVPGTGAAALVRATLDLLLWRGGPIAMHRELARIDLAVGAIGLGTLAFATYLLFRPVTPPHDAPDSSARDAAARLVRAHGVDTLAYFKLRRDTQYLFSSDQRAFLAYRIRQGVLLVSGDPVGPSDAVAELLADLAVYAERHGLRMAALGASEALRPAYEQLGLRALYIGDEAILDTRTFSLEGRAIRKVRQSVTRLERSGYTAQLVRLTDLGDAEREQLDAVAAASLRGSAERGFSMALDRLDPVEHGDTLVVLARDDQMRVRGFLHFVPVYGRPAVSLASMRRDPETPNGLTEYLVVRALALLAGGGIEEVSLNFAAFGRLLHDSERPLRRFVRSALRAADAVFQIERLYRFNAKFSPQWQPRYLMHEGAFALPRAGLAALAVEGQLPVFRRAQRAAA